MASIKDISDVHVGDTVTERRQSDRDRPCPATRSRSRWFTRGFIPPITMSSRQLREALSKLKLNDSSFTFDPENSEGLGFGFRCGFLGLLHREIIGQHLERDCEIDLVHTAPNVTYRDSQERRRGAIIVNSPQDVPDLGQVAEFREPIVKISFLAAGEEHRRHHVAVCGPPGHLCSNRVDLSPTRAIIVYELPLADVIYDLYDKLKSVTHGYGTMDYEFLGFRAADLVHLDVLVHHNRVDALSDHCASFNRGTPWTQADHETAGRKSIGICSRWPCKRRLAPG